MRACAHKHCTSHSTGRIAARERSATRRGATRTATLCLRREPAASLSALAATVANSIAWCCGGGFVSSCESTKTFETSRNSDWKQSHDSLPFDILRNQVSFPCFRKKESIMRSRGEWDSNNSPEPLTQLDLRVRYHSVLEYPLTGTGHTGPVLPEMSGKLFLPPGNTDRYYRTVLPTR